MSHSLHTLALIPDGNRRWAKREGKTSLQGHEEGVKKIKEVISWVRDAEIEELCLYAFSTENWNREKDEVEHLMHMVKEFCDNFLKEVPKDTCLRFIGDRTRLSKEVIEKMELIEERTKGNTGLVLYIALSYGGRAEILEATNALLKKGVSAVTEEAFSNALWSAGMRAPDAVIRTGGEKRLSNFLPWQSVYSELFFSDTLFPDFSKDEFEQIVHAYSEREQRRGI